MPDRYSVRPMARDRSCPRVLHRPIRAAGALRYGPCSKLCGPRARQVKHTCAQAMSGTGWSLSGRLAYTGQAQVLQDASDEIAFEFPIRPLLPLDLIRNSSLTGNGKQPVINERSIYNLLLLNPHTLLWYSLVELVVRGIGASTTELRKGIAKYSRRAAIGSLEQVLILDIKLHHH